MPRTDVSKLHITPSRLLAAEILSSLRGGELLDTAFDRLATPLDARDRRWAQELVFGSLRRRGALDVALDARVRGGLARLDPDLADLMRLGAYQLLQMDSVPAYAAIAQTVELAKARHGVGASKLVNAVLRRLDRERGVLDAELSNVAGDPIDVMAAQESHPRWLVARWVARWGEGETRALLRANNREAPVFVRPFGVVREQLEAMLDDAGVRTAEVPLVPDSLQLTTAVALRDLGVFERGHCFVQDPAATLVVRYAALPRDATVVDLCAAPGGKSLEMAPLVQRVIACDRSLGRLARVVENIRRVGATTVFPLVADARSCPITRADAVLLDAPCTGTGTFRRHPDARWRLRISDLAVMASQQRSMLRAAATLVRPGGLLIYSTCSLEIEENDAQVEQFLRDDPDFALEPPPDTASVPADVLDAGRLRVLPQRHQVDGAFAARLRRAERSA